MMARYRPDTGNLSAEEQVQESWIQLEYFLIDHPGGFGRVVLKKNANDNVSHSIQLYVKWGNMANSTPATIGGTANAHPGMINQTVMFDKMMQLMQTNFQQRMDDKDRLVELLIENQNLHNAVEGMQEPGMNETILREAIGAAKAIFMQPRQPVALGTAGVGDTPPAPQQAPAAAGGGQARPFSVDQAIQDAHLLKNSVPDYHPNDVIRAIALFAHQQPDQAKNYLGMLIQQVQQ